MDSRRKDLASYCMEQSKDSLKAAEICLENGILKDAVNCSYYAAFYAIKAVLALDRLIFILGREFEPTFFLEPTFQPF